MAASPTFDIGLVMAGAVSAGAYTAGVVDFLIEALDEWEKARNAPAAEVPRHQLRLKVISGASAGAITGAIAAGALATRFPPVRNGSAENKENKLFDCWVNDIDIENLLQDQDLGDDRVRVAPNWPRYSQARLKSLREQLEQRVEKVIGRLESQYFAKKKLAIRWLAGWVVQRKRNDIVDFVMDRIEAELKRFDLLG